MNETDLFERYSQTVKKLGALEMENQMLSDENTVLKQENSNLKRELKELKKEHAPQQTVLPFVAESTEEKTETQEKEKIKRHYAEYTDLSGDVIIESGSQTICIPGFPSFFNFNALIEYVGIELSKAQSARMARKFRRNIPFLYTEQLMPFIREQSKKLKCSDKKEA